MNGATAMLVNGSPSPSIALGAPRASGPVSVDICRLDDVPLGEGRAFRVGDRVLAIFRQRDGQVFAIDNACPHRGGALAEGIAGGGIVVCPLHGRKIDLQSGRCLGEDSAVQTYTVDVINSRIRVTVEAAA